jgi:alkaline phosphatase isozyme conversion protein
MTHEGGHMTRKKLAVLAAAMLLLILALSVAFAATGSLQAAPKSVPSAAPTAATSAYEYMAELSDGIGARVAGTPAAVKAADRISQWFADLGYQPSMQEFSFKADGASHPSTNVIATKAGASPKQIIIGAHYDSVAVGRGAASPRPHIRVCPTRESGPRKSVAYGAWSPAASGRGSEWN